MDESPTPPGRNRRLGLVLGLGVGAGVVACKGVEKLLSPNLGEWAAFGVGLLAAVVIAPAVGLVSARLLGGGTGGRA